MKIRKIVLSTAAGAGLFLAGTGIANADTVTVKSGDTVSSIAKTYQTTVANIEKLNHLADVNSIYVGEKLETGTSVKNQINAQPGYQYPSVQRHETTSAPAQTNKAVPATSGSSQLSQAVPTTNTSSQAKTTASNNSSATTTTTTSSSSESAAKAWIANKESGGSYTATNGQYYGKYQLTLSYLNGDLSASNQESVADSYVSSTYGSWSAAKSHWESYGWY
ncbi:LysM peptidoglycan-binding domain-containing protein [Ligilactobacillus acidipiscis]|uniref:aggregation-promoting factor n=1 Tax=Ligilactobacillus acidipiscis TaxID=89059 RepID=UPI0023F841EB|nr:LysM peptidoglycan-binding domain-containing protein [Ligilactobacillus acidipiscis]WEV56624.1 LysM peptidoglycan-binding domain-containing protein [Ligilactobacillus acidipiscis]